MSQNNSFGCDPAKPLFDDALAEQIPKLPFDPESSTKAAQQRRWEHSVVGQILKHYGLLRESPVLLDMVDGQARLTFKAFLTLHPSFPLWLTAVKVPYVHKITMTDFSRNFEKTRLYRAFVDAEAESPESFSLSTGVVFEWLHVWRTAIISNYYHAISSKGLVLFYNTPLTDDLMAIQSLDSFLHSLPWDPSANKLRD